MFQKKQSKLFDVNASKATSGKAGGNAFTEVGVGLALETVSAEGAKKYSSTGNDFVDQFGKAAKFRELRSFNDISDDMGLLYSQDREKAIAFMMYLRMITRNVKFFDGSRTEKVQRGQGLKHESIYRMIWLAVKDPDVFAKNLPLFISVGSWKDIFEMMRYDLEFNGWDNKVLDWKFLSDVILAGLENDETSDLVKKYLPQIKPHKKCTTLRSQANNLIAKYLCSKMFGTKMESPVGNTYKRYRLMKSSGEAHQWQQLISQGKLLEIDFKTIHGRALSLLVGGKFLKNNKLEEEYQTWLEAQPVLKYTGYVYELLAPVKSGYTNNNLKPYVEMTINKQFQMLVDVAKKDMDNITQFLVVVDSSSSMTSNVPGLKISAYDVAKAMALYFSFLLDGPFKGHFMEFADNSKLIKWKGSTPVQMLQNNSCQAYGGTHFESVANEFIRIKRSGVEESQFPQGILAISDGVFGGNKGSTASTQLKKRLLAGGFSKDYVNSLKIVIWDIPNNYYSKNQSSGFETLSKDLNMFYMSGFDGAGLAFITGKTKDGRVVETSEDLFEAAMNQEVFSKIVI